MLRVRRSRRLRREAQAASSYEGVDLGYEASDNSMNALLQFEFTPN
jgi:hypothetical protein